MGYAVGAADLCAAGLGAPHIRQRLWWVADAGHGERERRDALRGAEATAPRPTGTGAAAAAGGDDDFRFRQVDGTPDGSASSGVADAERGGLQRWGIARELGGAQTAEQGQGNQRERSGHPPGDSGPNDIEDSGGDNSSSDGTERELSTIERGYGKNHGLPRTAGTSDSTTSASGWSDYTEIPCLDGKVRRTESGTPPLVDGFSGRVEQLRAYGNAIVPQVAEVFIRAYLDREQR